MRNQTPGKVSLRNVRSATAAALENEKLTRERVDGLEAWAAATGERVAYLDSAQMVFMSRSFLGRLRWLLTGKVG